jgi:hypothetical protein
VLKSTQAVAGHHNEVGTLVIRRFTDLARCVTGANFCRLNQLRVDAALQWELREPFLRLVTQPGFALRNVGVAPLRQHWRFDYMQKLDRGLESPRQCRSVRQSVLRCD